jgi:hypothetical protein
MTRLAVVVLAALPFALLLVNDTWIWDDASFHDTQVYVGFFLR